MKSHQYYPDCSISQTSRTEKNLNDTFDTTNSFPETSMNAFQPKRREKYRKEDIKKIAGQGQVNGGRTDVKRGSDSPNMYSS